MHCEHLKGGCLKQEKKGLTGELLVFAGDLQAHAAGAAAVEATQFEGGASVSHGVRGQNQRSPSAPPWDDLQQPHAAQKMHLKST